MPDANTSSNPKTSDAESMEKKINAKVARRPSLAQPWTIHRVPHSIRAVDKDAYEPKMLSIGPYHRSNPNLQAMEDHKWRYVQAIIRGNRNRKLSDYLDKMKGLEVEVRSFYSENIEMESKEFVEMMLLDGCFIVELFLNLNDRNATAETDDPIYSTKWILPIIRLDMLLLENQLPLLVVNHIFQLVNVPNTSSSIEELALRFFGHLMPMKKEFPSSANSIPHSRNSIHHSRNSIHHLLQLYHMHLIPTTLQSDTTDQGGNAAVAIYPDNIRVPPPPQSDTTDQGGNAAVAIYLDNIPVPPPPQSDTTDQGGNAAAAIYQDNRPVPPPRSIMSASDLRHYLRLTKKENASSIVEVELKGGRLEIPTLWINHSTNSILRNLIAWELCYPKCGTQFTSYAFFMDCLIDSPKDVAILKDLNIIEHWLGSNEAVALLFNRMCIGITYDSDNNFLSDLFKQVVRLQRSRLRIFGHRLVRNKFSEPWKLINFQIAFMTFVFAIIQVYISLGPTTH